MAIVRVASVCIAVLFSWVVLFTWHGRCGFSDPSSFLCDTGQKIFTYIVIILAVSGILAASNAFKRKGEPRYHKLAWVVFIASVLIVLFGIVAIDSIPRSNL